MMVKIQPPKPLTNLYGHHYYYVQRTIRILFVAVVQSRGLFCEYSRQALLRGSRETQKYRFAIETNPSPLNLSSFTLLPPAPHRDLVRGGIDKTVSAFYARTLARVYM